MGLDEFNKHRMRKAFRKAASEKDLMLACAGDFGRLIADAQITHALPVEVAFEAAREHVRIYGKAMMEFAELVTAEEMCPPEQMPKGWKPEGPPQ